MTVIETERLILRTLTLEDASFMLGLLNEPSFLANIGDRGIKNLEDSAHYILKGPIQSYENYGFSMYCVTLKTTGEPIGVSGLVKRDGLNDVDIGFAFLPAFWSKGYAVESALGVLKFAKETIGLKRLVGITSPENDASVRVLEKMGMSYEGMVSLPREGPPVKLFGIQL
jgi:RimJ/RimL family protein N-acetyltransferase